MKNPSLLLLAMSGVRVQDADLLSLGLTLPGFVERGRVIASLPSLGLLTLAGLTPAHWRVEYREVDDPGGFDMRDVANGGYDLVAISSLAARVFDAYAIADRIREQGVAVVIGGLHASALPREAMAYADAVVQGEGEAVWCELLEDFENGRLRALYTSFGRRNFPLAESPVPRYDLLDRGSYNRLTIQTSRGCPLDCSFCAASRTISRFKLKPIESVRRELEAILAVWPRPFIELADDNTFASKRWGKELARLFAEYPVRWFTETDVSVADDDELLGLLAESGCAQLLIGLESVDREALRTLDSRARKYAWQPGYAASIERIQSYGISVNGCFVLGFDEDYPGVFERMRDFVRQSGLSEVQVTLLTPFPGTALHADLKRQGRLLEDVFWEKCTLFDVTYRPARMSATELRDGFRWLVGELYCEKETAARKAKFRKCARTARQRGNHEPDI